MADGVNEVGGRDVQGLADFGPGEKLRQVKAKSFALRLQSLFGIGRAGVRGRIARAVAPQQQLV
jgi:hypothetical protein